MNGAQKIHRDEDPEIPAPTSFLVPPPSEGISTRSSGSDLLRAPSYRSAESFLSESCDKLIASLGYDAAVEAAFDIFDANGNGLIDRHECEVFLRAAASRLNLDLEDEVISAAVDALIEEAGGETDDHCITKSQFVSIFHDHPDLLTVFQTEEAHQKSIRAFNEGTPLTPAEKKRLWMDNQQAREHVKSNLKDNGVLWFWFGVFILGNIAAFTYKATYYARNRDDATAVFGNCILVARGAANALNLNASLILLPVCRHLLTALRATRLRFFLPFDSPIESHIAVGIAFALFSTAHVCAHICDFYRFADASEQDIIALFGSSLGDDIPAGKWDRWKLMLGTRAGVTGIIMVVCLIVAYAFLTKRRTAFNQFWISHHLLLVMIICMCIHGTDNLLEHFKTLYWVIGPLSFYMIPKILRETRCARLDTIHADVKKGGVIGLRMVKPKLWDGYVKAGMYAFINIPQVSRIEWHPFTLTSSPCDDYVELHFRKVGDWTTKAHDMYKKLAEQAVEDKQIQYPIVKVDGPIGASSQSFSDFPVVVLVGAGIGVTPMISVLRQLLVEPGKMKRTFFYWTVRERDSFTWFTSLMDDIFEKDTENRLQVRHFLTSAKQDHRDMGAVLLHHATRAVHHKTDIDLVLGHRAHHQVEVGRPNWTEELKSVYQEASALGYKKCGVFLCGPDAIAQSIMDSKKELLKTDASFHFDFSKETF